MKRILFIAFLASSFAFSDTDTDIKKDVKKITQDMVQTGTDLNVLFQDTLDCVKENIPSVGTLGVDAAVDSCMRQSESLEAFIEKLEEKNPVNAAIVRDISKALTVMVKMYFEIAVNQSGRIYDKADLYAQFTKVFSKAVGLTGLWGTGMLKNGLAIWLVNQAGDVLSQAVLDVGGDWRQTNSTSFEQYLIENYSARNTAFSIPAKGTVSYVMGWVIKKFSLIEAAEIASLVILNQVQLVREAEMNTATWASRIPFLPGFASKFVVSVMKSLILTTSCKSAIQGVNNLVNGYFDSSSNAEPTKIVKGEEKEEL